MVSIYSKVSQFVKNPLNRDENKNYTSPQEKRQAEEDLYGQLEYEPAAIKKSGLTIAEAKLRAYKAREELKALRNQGRGVNAIRTGVIKTAVERDKYNYQRQKQALELAKLQAQLQAQQNQQIQQRQVQQQPQRDYRSGHLYTPNMDMAMPDTGWGFSSRQQMQQVQNRPQRPIDYDPLKHVPLL